MFKCQRHFNFKNDLVNRGKLLYKNVKSCVTKNGHDSEFFHLRRSVRQGCHLPHTYLSFALNYTFKLSKTGSSNKRHIHEKKLKHLSLKMMHILYRMDQTNLLETEQNIG